MSGGLHVGAGRGRHQSSQRRGLEWHVVEGRGKWCTLALLALLRRAEAPRRRHEVRRPRRDRSVHVVDMAAIPEVIRKDRAGLERQRHSRGTIPGLSARCQGSRRPRRVRNHSVDTRSAQ